MASMREAIAAGAFSRFRARFSERYGVSAPAEGAPAE
jgi:hypothetical protein